MPDGVGCSSSTTNSARRRWARQCWRPAARTSPGGPPWQIRAREPHCSRIRSGPLLPPRCPVISGYSTGHETGCPVMPAVLWFRRDLRLRDLPPLLTAVANTDEVLACFVLDPRLEASSGARRMQFLCDSLRQLHDDLDGRLLVTRGRPEERIPAIAKEVDARSVHVSEDFAPFGRRREDRSRDPLDDASLVATDLPYLASQRRVRKDNDDRYKGFHPLLMPMAPTGLAK